MTTEQTQNVELAYYFRVAWRRKIFILLATVVAMMGGAAYSLLQPNIYQATATLVVLPPGYKTELALPPFSVQTYENLLRSPELFEGIIDTLNLREATVEGISRSLRAEIIQEKYGSNRIDYSPLIKLQARANSPRKAMDLANTWAELFVQMVRGMGFKGKEGALELIHSQFEETVKNLEAAEDRLKDFQGQWRIELLEKELAAREQNLVESESALYAVRLDLNSAEERLARMQEEIEHHDRTLILSKAITDDALWEQAVADSSILTPARLADLTLKSESLNPVFENLEQRIVNGEVTLSELQAKETYLERDLARLHGDIGRLQKILVEKRLAQERLAREVDNYRRTYTVLAEKAESARLARAEESEDIKIASRAVKPSRRIGPNRRQAVLTAGLVGLILSVLLAFIFEYIPGKSSGAIITSADRKT